MDELKPCPFCGDMPLIHESKQDLRNILYSVFCGGEHHTASVGYFYTEEEAIEAWNRRAEDGK